MADQHDFVASIFIERFAELILNRRFRRAVLVFELLALAVFAGIFAGFALLVFAAVFITFSRAYKINPRGIV